MAKKALAKPPPTDLDKPSRMMTVYPHVWASRLLGGHLSRPFNQAIECLAFLLAGATRDNEKLFVPQQWAILAGAVPLLKSGACRLLDPSSPDPGQALAAALRNTHALAPLAAGKEGDLAVAIMSKKLENLDYLHAWAVVWSLQWKRCEPDAAGEQWWTLASRQQV